jgi:hypothetical protein
MIMYMPFSASLCDATSEGEKDLDIFATASLGSSLRLVLLSLWFCDAVCLQAMVV